MFGCAVIAKETKCRNVGELIDLLKKHPRHTPLQSGFEMGVKVEQHENKEDRTEYYLSFDEAEPDDDDDE